MREQKAKKNKTRIPKSGCRLFLAIMILLSLTACGKEEPATREPIPDREPAPTTEVDILTGDGVWINFDEMSITINDHTYILGKNTMADIAKDGTIVYDASAKGAEELLKPDEKSDRFSVRLADGWGVNLYSRNIGDDDRRAKDCVISEVNLIMDDKEMKENRLSFTFPLTITPDTLLKTAGKPSKLEDYKDDKLGDVYETYIYKYRNKSYSFKFTNKELMVVELSFE